MAVTLYAASLILTGGNSKLQPAWSKFTVGQTGLLFRQPSETSPSRWVEGLEAAPRVKAFRAGIDSLSRVRESKAATRWARNRVVFS